MIAERFVVVNGARDFLNNRTYGEAKAMAEADAIRNPGVTYYVAELVSASSLHEAEPGYDKPRVKTLEVG